MTDVVFQEVQEILIYSFGPIYGCFLVFLAALSLIAAFLVLWFSMLEWLSRE